MKPLLIMAFVAVLIVAIATACGAGAALVSKALEPHAHCGVYPQAPCDLTGIQD